MEKLRLAQDVAADWDRQPNGALHYERLDEMERLCRSGSAEDGRRLIELYREFQIECSADLAEVDTAVKRSLVTYIDEIRREVKKNEYDLSSAFSFSVKKCLSPYLNAWREKMLSEIPLEERHKLEEEKRRLDEVG